MARSLQLAEQIETILDSKNGQDIEILKIDAKTTLADYFVIVTGSSTIHVKTLADEVVFQIKEKLDISPGHIEGLEDRRWVLIDYGDVVVHVFHQEERNFYDLERLWTATDSIRDHKTAEEQSL
ncbi:MAG: ribosome silencing factor [Clostridiaceae bacterium]|nr:ribosome silencing factor [Clostridiaceae bacterium]